MDSCVPGRAQSESPVRFGTVPAIANKTDFRAGDQSPIPSLHLPFFLIHRRALTLLAASHREPEHQAGSSGRTRHHETLNGAAVSRALPADELASRKIG